MPSREAERSCNLRMLDSTQDPSTMPDNPPSPNPHAEDHYYAALDLVAEGHNEEAVAEYRQSLAADPNFTDALHGLSRGLSVGPESPVEQPGIWLMESDGHEHVERMEQVKVQHVEEKWHSAKYHYRSCKSRHAKFLNRPPNEQRRSERHQ